MEISNLWERLRPRLQAQSQQGLSGRQIANFCGAKPDTVRDWKSGKHPPQGERLLRLWHLLALMGSDSPELESLPAFNHKLSELVAFRVISLDEACEIARAPQIQKLHRILRGHQAIHAQLNASELEELYGSKLKRVRADLVRQLGRTAVQKVVSSPPAASKQAVSKAWPSDRDLTRGIVEADAKLVLATLLGAALPLARRLDSHETSAQERAAFRDLVGQENLFALSNLLNSLCSERARTSGR